VRGAREHPALIRTVVRPRLYHDQQEVDLMIRRVTARLSYANIAATLAVFLALGGSAAWAIGRHSVGTRELAKDAVKGRHVEETKLKGKHLQDSTLGGREIDEQKLDAPVPTANRAEQADGPSAFARVEPDATVIEGLSRQVSSAMVTGPAAGVYCFDLPFNPLHVRATALAGGTSDRVVSAADSDGPGGVPNCPTGTETEVNVYSISAGALENGGFFVSFGL
jgi:hypothetical protein